MRTPVLAANWKMHKTVDAAAAFTDAFLPRVAEIADVEIVLAPPFIALAPVAEACRATRVGVAGQDLYWEAEGAYTGEVSAGMLAAAGASHVIIGHSERRQLFGEDDAGVARKVRAAVDAGLTPIVCVGETLAQRESGDAPAVLARQLEGGLAGLTPREVTALIVAYEPVWAIGTGRTATPDQAQRAHAHLRQRLVLGADAEAATHCRIIYGGSVKPANARALSTEADVDGALVGGASLDAASFAEIVANSRPGTGSA